MHGEDGRISIWFFIGVLVLIYGVLILAAGLYMLAYPPTEHVVLQNLHPDVWWGAMMVVLGAIYTAKFFPKKGSR